LQSYGNILKAATSGKSDDIIDATDRVRRRLSHPALTRNAALIAHVR